MAKSARRNSPRRPPSTPHARRARARAGSRTGWATAPAALLSNLSQRGAFRSFTAAQPGESRAVFSLGWHRERVFQVTVDGSAQRIRVTEVLPNVPPRSAMDRAFRRFLQDFSSPERPAHRRIDPSRATLRCVNHAGSLAVTLQVHDGDFDYATRKLLAVVDETYQLFLMLNDYSGYKVRNLGANPDWGK